MGASRTLPRVRALHNANPTAFPNGNWFAGDNINLSIGQGEVVVTPIQLAQMYAAFAESGKAIRAPRRQRSLDQHQERQGDRGRVHSPRSRHRGRRTERRRGRPDHGGAAGRGERSEAGTAHNAFRGFPYDTFPIAGKTGTAQVRTKQDTALFAAVGPTFDPAVGRGRRARGSRLRWFHRRARRPAHLRRHCRTRRRVRAARS